MQTSPQGTLCMRMWKALYHMFKDAEHRDDILDEEERSRYIALVSNR